MADLNLDSVHFDPRRYISNFLRNNTLKDLIKKNNEVEEQIKAHDHQIQSLVFENYSKFIASIDTVKQMKTDISKVDDKLKNLDKSMQKISELALKIDNTFAVKRKQIQKLDTINKDLQKLKNLCEFPDILKADLQFYKSLEKAEEKPYQQLFQKSVVYYKECFSTLQEFKNEALIAPIYQDSINKVEEMRTVLWNLQSLLKSRTNSKDLRSITRKSVTVAQQQLPPLRTYFKKSKDKFNQNCLANEKYFPPDEFSTDTEVEAVAVAAANSQILAKALADNRPFLNEAYWQEFEQDFLFVSQQLLPVLVPSQEVDQLINSSLKEVFICVLDNFYNSVQKHCFSNIHLSILLEKVRPHFRNVIQNTHVDSLKRQFEKLLNEKLEQLCINQFSAAFTRLKMAILSQYQLQKSFVLTVKIGQETYKEAFGWITPVKMFISSNYIRLLVGLLNVRDHQDFLQRNKSVDLMLTQITQLGKFICYFLSTTSHKASEQMIPLIHQTTSKQSPIQKKVEQAVIKFKSVPDCGLTYLLNHNLLANIQNKLWGTLVSDFCNIFGLVGDNLGKERNDKIAAIAQLFKKSISKNMSNFSIYYVARVEDVYSQPEQQSLYFSLAVKHVEEFVEISSYMFPDSRKNIPKKPSLLNNSDRAVSYETDVMLAKKTHMFDKKDAFTRSTLLSSFNKGVLKAILRNIRQGLFSSSKFQSEIYCLVQLCYELSGIDEDSVVSAYFYIIRGQYYRSDNVKVDKAVLDGVYSMERAKIKI